MNVALLHYCPGNRDVLAGYDKWKKLVF